MITDRHLFDMVRIIAMTVALLLMAAGEASAQNSIDRLVDDISDLGSANFTSVVERNPATRKVKKVVKVLKMNSYNDPDEFERAFRREAHTGNLVETVKGAKTTLVLTVESPRDKRVYMMTYNTVTEIGVEVTIVINFK